MREQDLATVVRELSMTIESLTTIRDALRDSEGGELSPELAEIAASCRGPMLPSLRLAQEMKPLQFNRENPLLKDASHRAR